VSKSLVIESGGDVYQSRIHPERSIRVLHQRGAVALIVDVVKAGLPQVIVEFGCGNGGLTLAFHEACPDAHIWAVDAFMDAPASRYIVERQDQFTGGWAYSYPPEIAGQPTPRAWFGHAVYFGRGDTDRVPDIVADPFCRRIHTTLQGLERKVLYCDGGDVVKEVDIWSGFLRSGDLLGVHRWGLQFHEAQEQAFLRGFSRHRWGPFEEAGYMTRFWVKC
jgi:hypothetical protein